MPNAIKFDIGKLNKVIANLTSAYVIKVGILGNSSARGGDSGLTNAQVGLSHEFGTLDGKTPQRSFLRQPLQLKGKELLNESLAVIKKDIAVDKGNEKILKKIGFAAENVIQGAFETGGYGKWDALSPETIANKGSSSILIDQGELRKSITSTVVKVG
tara:strand:- start:14848 stop:15321 length:474 start_codon:yes stop_codon:yes gene_type:complete